MCRWLKSIKVKAIQQYKNYIKFVSTIYFMHSLRKHKRQLFFLFPPKWKWSDQMFWQQTRGSGLCWEANMLKSRHSVIISSHCTTIYNPGKHNTFQNETLNYFMSLNEFHLNKQILLPLNWYFTAGLL